MIDTLQTILAASWDVLLESAPYMLLGFFMAGLLRAFVPTDLVQRHLGRNRLINIIKASLFGVPIPLCSCGVVPAAAGLRKQGASKGATAAFLISTPETGVDSMAVTYALLDPLMTILRPVAAFFTATFAGIAVNMFPDKNETDAVQPMATTEPPAGCGCSSGSCDIPQTEGTTPQPEPPKPTVIQRALDGLSFAFGDLLKDIGLWFLFGVIMAGAITALAPEDFIAANLGQGILPMLLTLVVAIPMYVCATASTPIAAALALKGLSPGAAMVFLLAGPATNAASIAMVGKIIGKRATVVYLASIMTSSLLLGLAADQLYVALGFSVTDWVNTGQEHGHPWYHLASAILLLILLIRVMLPARAPKNHSGHTGHAH